VTDICVVDLGFGDAGKGTIVDYLARENPEATIVRFNGGAQAAHNVVTDTGVHHTFAQFGSGTLAGNPTHLSRYMLVNPMNMLQEARHLAVNADQWDVFDRLTIDPDALVTTRLHMAWNRIEEITRGNLAHGSCGQGIGATVEYSLSGREHLCAGTLTDPADTLRLLRQIQDHYTGRLDRLLAGSTAWSETLEYECNILRNLDLDRVAEEYETWSQIIQFRLDADLTGDLIFEGAQGIGLDERHGTAPHNTWSDCTPRRAMQILNTLARPRARIIGVTRTYTTRHGAGPFPTETSTLDRPELHNSTGTYQGGWRVGHLDCGLLNHSLRVCRRIGFPVDEVAVTHMDMLDDHNPVSVAYQPTLPPLGDSIENLGTYECTYRIWPRERFAGLLERTLNTPVTILSYGPTAQDKKVLCDSSL
jgi:adenylosuccinate synthase